MTGTLQADGVQSRQTLFVRYCLSYYESGGHDIPTEVLVRIADFYQVSVDYLLNRTDKREMNR